MFIFFVTFTYFAVLNVVTALFCQTAVESSMCDQDILLEKKTQGLEVIRSRLEKLFLELDDLNQNDDSPEGMFTFEELQDFMQEPRVQARFGILGIEADDAWSLFKLIDEEQSDIVSIENFVKGCMKLRGEATRLDLELFAYSFRFHMNKLDRFMEHVASRMAKDEETVHQLDTMLQDEDVRVQNLAMQVETEQKRKEEKRKVKEVTALSPKSAEVLAAAEDNVMPMGKAAETSV